MEFRVSYIFYYLPRYSEIFNDECDVVDMTWNDHYAKVKVIHFGTNQFLIYDFLYPVSSNFCYRTQRLATIYTLQQYHVNFHAYADDNQLYLYCRRDDMMSVSND